MDRDLSGIERIVWATWALSFAADAASRNCWAGELALLPTDTVYGIAAAAVLPDACAQLYSLKQRPLDQPTAMMLGSLEGLLRDRCRS